MTLKLLSNAANTCVPPITRQFWTIIVIAKGDSQRKSPSAREQSPFLASLTVETVEKKFTFDAGAQLMAGSRVTKSGRLVQGGKEIPL